jgi:hypothetical protein
VTSSWISARAHAADLVRGDRHPDAAAFEEDADFRLALGDRAGGGDGHVDVVAARRGVAAESRRPRDRASSSTGRIFFLASYPRWSEATAIFISGQHFLVQPLVDQLHHLPRELLVEREVAADRVVDVAGGVERQVFSWRDGTSA